MNTNLKGEIEFLIKPLAIFVLIIALFVTVLVLGIKQISSIGEKNDGLKRSVSSLEQKVATLEEVEQVLAGDNTFLDIVLPGKGAVLYGLSQIKNQAVQNNVSISSIKTGNEIKVNGDISKNAIGFEVEGEEANVYLFLQSFSKILPLMNVDKVSLVRSESIARATVSLSVYSAELPKRIPAVTEAVKDLTPSEVDLLKEISQYSLPLFIEPVPDTGQTVKENPFN